MLVVKKKDRKDRDTVSIYLKLVLKKNRCGLYLSRKEVEMDSFGKERDGAIHGHVTAKKWPKILIWGKKKTGSFFPLCKNRSRP